MSVRAYTRLLAAAASFLLLFGIFHWTVDRIYVPPGHSLRLQYKGPLLFGSRGEIEAGHFAKEGEIGVYEQLRGPGRHFYCPLWWRRDVVPDFVINPGEVGIVTSKLGDALPEGQFLVNGDLDGPDRASRKGVLRKVLAPGRYRINTYAYQVETIQRKQDSVGEQTKYSGWVQVPTGYVGVATYLADNPLQTKQRGIQSKVLPPGLYATNPLEQQIDIVEIGFRETSITVERQTDRTGKRIVDESGEPLAVAESGIGFPSNDGFGIQLDFTAVWGVMPTDAPKVVQMFGGIDQAEQKVILPQSESICRNTGSKMGAVDLLIGETRQQFQSATSLAFQDVLKDKHLTLLYGLVRHIYIPQPVRIPIQKGYVAEELTLTREQERLTAVTEGTLREAEKKVELESERVRAETEKLVAELMAEGEKEAKEIAAETKRKVAEVDRQIAELESKKKVLLGEAEGNAEKMFQEATAQKFQLAVHAFGSADAYNKWQFAEGLPEDIDLRLFYAGEGTLWTDLKGVMPTLPIATPKSTPSEPPPGTLKK